MNYPNDNQGKFSDCQRKVSDFVAEHDIEALVHARLLDISSEVGELSKEYLKATDYGRAPFVEPPDGWQDELGDVLFSVICLANSTGVDLETALQRALDKYEDRLRRGGDAGSVGGQG